MVEIHGHAQEQFGRVRDTFEQNFTERGDRGAACAVVIDGELVVDVWAGHARADAAWRGDTKTTAFSVSKGITTVLMAVAVQEGHLDFGAPVSRYWPEFGVNGKNDVSVREVLAHRAGLPAFGRAWSSADLDSWFPVVDDLAAQQPLWEPGSSYIYHPVSLGFLAGEILRRATSLRPAQWLARVNETLGTALAFGSDTADANLAHLFPPAEEDETAQLPSEFRQLVRRAMLEDGAYGPNLFTAANTPSFLGPESPAANLVATARDVATFYGATVSDSHGPRILRDDTIADVTIPLSYGQPFVGQDAGLTWGTGFMLPSARRKLAGAGSFGHDGAGGQLAFASPTHRLGFAYLTNQMGSADDARAEKLSEVLRECL